MRGTNGVGIVGGGGEEVGDDGRGTERGEYRFMDRR